jgi:WD40 repeat protein
MLASGSIDHTVKLWRVQDGALLNTLLGHDGQVTGLSFLPDGMLASSGEDAVILWRPTSRINPVVFRGHKGLIDVRVEFSPDGRWLAMTTNVVVSNTLGVGTVVLRTVQGDGPPVKGTQNPPARNIFPITFRPFFFGRFVVTISPTTTNINVSSPRDLTSPRWPSLG